ncbi:uncharacterized protein LOC122250333 [Penaeus japonicus]|uniref:uncharacterized protein LOC122250333 n=1 Tax=Penaeus japonicus TaxID=27405 RepID=UPI001C716AB0|nr:uncharacterized protein LOC122250333 [Penaeus japonicus]
MVGLVRDIVIPVKGDPVFTIVCEILTTPSQNTQPQQEEEVENPHITRLWKMASAWRVISFFLVVFVLPTVLISLPLYARYHLYHARHLPMTETDTRALNHAVSSFWCQGQRVTTNGTLDAFLVAGTPRLLTQRRHVVLRKNLTLQHDDIEYWGVYLLEGSSFSLASCARWPGGTLLVVQGEENLRKCFYKEQKVQNELNGGTHGVQTVYHGDADAEPDDGRRDEGNDEDEDVGGEVFDDDDEDRDLRLLDADEEEEEREEGEGEERAIEGNGDEVALTPSLAHPKNLKHRKNEAVKLSKRKPRKGKKHRKGKKNNKEEEQDEDKDDDLEGTRRGRTRRSRLVERIRRSSPGSFDDNRQITLEEKLEILHRLNDTVDITSGNSSFSSSEEFLEQCKDTILTVDLSPFIDCRTRMDTLNLDSQDQWTVKINTTDYYYFIFTSDNSIELNLLDFNLDLQRAIYDVSAPLETCRNATECVFPLAFTQEEAVVVEVPAQEKLQELHSFEVTTTCQPRVPVYMVFILLVPFIILLFAFQ